MKKAFLLSLLSVLMPMSVLADTADATDVNVPRELYFDIRRIGLEMSKTKVQNSEYYQKSAVQALTADSQDFIKGIADLALEYHRGKFKWDNSLFMEYGKTTLKPYDEPSTTNENADKILLSSDLSWACWKWGDFSFGPTIRGAYETEFVASGDAPRQNLLRAGAGLSLFDHPIIKTLYLTSLYEYDFTYAHETVSKSGVEAGWRMEYKVRDGVKFTTNGYYREYLSYSNYYAMDLERDLNAVLRLDTNLWGNFTMGPYTQYRLARARGVHKYGSNFIIGVSFNYIMRYNLLTPPTE